MTADQIHDEVSQAISNTLVTYAAQKKQDISTYVAIATGILHATCGPLKTIIGSIMEDADDDEVWRRTSGIVERMNVLMSDAVQEIVDEELGRT